MNNDSNKNKLKITKEQYNRIFASGLIKENIIEMQFPKVKGGLTRVDKAFKQATNGENISNINVANEENIKTSDFNIKTPIKGLSSSIQGKFDKPMMENEDQLKKETLELIKYLYRKSDEFSQFWGQNDLTYDDICDALEASRLVIKKDGGYELSKTLGSPDKAINAVEEELRTMLGNDKTPKDELEEGDWFDSLSNNPANQPDSKYSKGTHIKNPKLQVITYTGEFAFVKSNDNGLYVFYYGDIDRDSFLGYVDREIIDSEPDGEGGYDNEYSDDWDIDKDVLNDYINDNISRFKVGEGLVAWESGDFDLVKIDDELRQDFLEMYDKDPMVTKGLGGLNENETEGDKMTRIKAVIAQRRADSQRYEDEFFKRRDAQNKLDSKNAKKAMKIKDMPEPDSIPVGQYNAFGGVDEMDGGAMGGTNTMSVGGQFTPSLSTGDSSVMKREMPNIPVVKEDLGLGYTHFAIFKSDGKIADGWDYADIDNESIKYYTKEDLVNNFPENRPSDFKVVTINVLNRMGIDPSDTNNWYKPTMNETMSVASAGNFQYDTPGGLTMDLGKNNPKTSAEKKTQWAGGAFVDFNDCVKMNNKPAGTGCSAGAVDNVVKLKKTKGNINAPSLGENKIYEAIAKKTGKTIDEVKAIITSKNTKG